MTWLLLALGLYAGICVLVYFFQDRLMFFPARRLDATPAVFGLTFEDVRLPLAGGKTAHAWWVPRDDPRGAAVCCHGNGGNISHRVHVLRRLHGLGLSVLIFDYPGYGQSDGTPTEEGVHAAAEAAWRHVRDARGVAADRIVIWGRSLGAAVAVELASKHAPRAMIVESGMTSIVDVAKKHYFWLPVAWFCKFRFDARSKIGGVTCPKLFVHSRDDDIVPFEFGRKLFDAAPEPKRFVEIRGTHNDGQENSSAYREAVREFLDEVL